MYFVTYSGSKNLTSIIKFILFNIGSKTINKITLVFNIIPATNELKIKTSFECAQVPRAMVVAEEHAVQARNG